jgi:hypothetical protein
MKFAFILDTSPLMQLRQSVYLPATQIGPVEESKRISITQPAQQTGMSLFEQSVYAIEEFVLKRKQIGAFKSDKYFLALTAASAEDNYSVMELDENAESESGIKVLSSWEHPYKHFVNQLHNIRNPRRHSKIKRSLLEMLNLLNGKRFLTGADNRLYGTQLSKIEPASIILFTASPRMSNSCLEHFKKLKPDSELFDEAFRWDQSLHACIFRDTVKNNKKQHNSALLDLCELTGGSHAKIESFV